LSIRIWTSLTYPDRKWKIYHDQSSREVRGVAIDVHSSHRSSRFYDPSSGRISVDGKDISEIDPGSYRKNLSLVAQESTLYDGTSANLLAASCG